MTGDRLCDAGRGDPNPKRQRGVVRAACMCLSEYVRSRPVARAPGSESAAIRVTTGALILVALVGGCGYSTKRPFRTDIQTVHVEMFQSREFRRELEFRLTESVIKRLEMDSPYKVAPRNRADALLTGEIVRVDNRTFGDDFNTDLPREIGSTVVVRYRLQDLRSGEILVERPRFVYQTSYIPPVGETFTQGMTRAMDGLAEQIVESMESSW